MARVGIRNRIDNNKNLVMLTLGLPYLIYLVSSKDLPPSRPGWNCGAWIGVLGRGQLGEFHYQIVFMLTNLIMFVWQNCLYYSLTLITYRACCCYCVLCLPAERFALERGQLGEFHYQDTFMLTNLIMFVFHNGLYYSLTLITGACLLLLFCFRTPCCN